VSATHLRNRGEGLFTNLKNRLFRREDQEKEKAKLGLPKRSLIQPRERESRPSSRTGGLEGLENLLFGRRCGEVAWSRVAREIQSTCLIRQTKPRRFVRNEEQKEQGNAENVTLILQLKKKESEPRGKKTNKVKVQKEGWRSALGEITPSKDNT